VSTRSRTIVVVAALCAVAGAGIGYALEGVGLAIVEFLVFVLAGVFVGKFLPALTSPSPSSIARPPVGDSLDAVRQRRNERLTAGVTGVPIAFLLGVVALIAEPLEAKLAVAALAVLVVGWTALLWASSGRSAFWDRVRLGLYERAVARAEEQRRRYDEQQVDRRRERQQLMRVGQALVGMHVAMLVLGLALVPGLLAERSSSPVARTAGAILSAGLFLGLLVAGTLLLVRALGRWWKRRSNRDG